jgi:hypothetical protein
MLREICGHHAVRRQKLQAPLDCTGLCKLHELVMNKAQTVCKPFAI